MRGKYAPTVALILAASAPVAAQPILYVSSFNGPVVSRIPAPFTVQTYATGLTTARGVARDSAGNLYVADAPNFLRIVPEGGGPAQPFASGFNFPQGVTLGPDGFVYVANSGNDTVMRVGLGGGIATVFATGFDGPAGLRFGPDGNLYVANFTGDTVSRVGPGGGAAAVFATGFNNPRDVAFDANGMLYASDYGGSTVSRVGTGGGVATVFAVGLSAPFGLEFDPEGSGNLFVVNDIGDSVSIVNPMGIVNAYAIGVPGASYIAVQVPEPSVTVLCLVSLGSAGIFRQLKTARGKQQARANT